MAEPITYEVVLFGAPWVGKKCLSIALVKNEYWEDYEPNIEDVYQKSYQINGKYIVLQILSSEIGTEFSSLRDQLMRKCDAFMLCFSVKDLESLELIKEIPDRIQRCKDVFEDWPASCVVATKCDFTEEERKVSIGQVEDWALTRGMKLFQTSAKNLTGIDEPFEYIVRLCVETEEKRRQLTNDGQPSEKSKDAKQFFHKNGCALS